MSAEEAIPDFDLGIFADDNEPDRERSDSVDSSASRRSNATMRSADSEPEQRVEVAPTTIEELRELWHLDQCFFFPRENQKCA